MVVETMCRPCDGTIDEKGDNESQLESGTRDDRQSDEVETTLTAKPCLWVVAPCNAVPEETGSTPMQIIAFLTLLATAFTGLASGPAVLSIILCAVILAAISGAEHHNEYQRVVSIGGWRFALFCFGHSLFNAGVAAAAAYGLGIAIRLMSGL